jgi:hypothetical protein
MHADGGDLVSKEGKSSDYYQNAKSGPPFAVADWLCIGLIVAVNSVLFFREIFCGRAISRVSRLAEWDSVFQQYAGGGAGSCDPSLAQLLVPNYFLVANMWHQGIVPLWNPYCGTGVPLIGDIQASVLAPVHWLLAVFPSARTYNLILVGEIAVSCLGVYWLARLLTLCRPGAVFAAFAYGFSPFILCYLELLSGTSHALLPLLLASFVLLARKTGFWPLLGAVLATSTYVLSGHPESSLYGVVAAVVLYSLVRVTLSRSDSSYLNAVADVGLVGFFSFCFCAPVLLPFAELVGCGESYKFAVGQSAFAPWPSLLLNLITPVNSGTSPFLGALVLPMLAMVPAAARRGRGLICGIYLGILFAFFFIAQLWPFSWILLIRPFSYLVTIYLIPVFLLGISVLAGMGLNALAEHLKVGSKLPLSLLLMALSLILSWLLIGALHWSALDLSFCNFDDTQPTSALALSSVILNAVLQLLVLAVLVLLACFRASPMRKKNLANCSVWLIVLLNLVSLLVNLRVALPLQPKFNFPRAEIIDYLAKTPGRVLSVCEHVLKPNANCVYGIASFRVHNPILPAHFCDIARLCGADIDAFQNQSYSKGISAFVDLGSIRYVLSQYAPLDSRYRQVYLSKEAIGVYENTQARPQAYLSEKFQIAADEQQALALLKLANPLDKPLVIVADAAVQGELSKLAGDKTLLKAEAQCSRPSPNEVVINTKSNRAALLVLTDTFYPGWSATVDGAPAAISRANLLFRAVPVSAGKHQVRFNYLPRWFLIGLALAGAAMLSLVIAGPMIGRWRKHC